MKVCDAVVIGSGINGLVAGALLSQRGWEVAVLERSAVLGGAIRTTELTLPGFHHEMFSSFHPQFVGSKPYRELRTSLERLGLRYLNTDVPTAVTALGGEAAVLSRSLEANVAELDRLHSGDGSAFAASLEQLARQARTIEALMGDEISSAAGLLRVVRSAAGLKMSGLARLGQDALEPARAWLGRTFRSPLASSLLAPWGLHAGLGPDDAGSALTTRLIIAAIGNAGCPVPQGGGTALVDALATLITDAGGTVTPGVDVDQILVERSRATGVVTADGEKIRARRAVIASVTPTALYGTLLREAQVPGDIRDSARRFRYGNGCMMIHLAMSEPPRWKSDHARLSKAAVVHVNGDVADISLARCLAANNTLPTRPMIAFGQPVALDPSRAPAGASIGWIQLLDTPYRPLRDSINQIATDGAWTSDVRERYADRVVDILRDHIENLESATLARVCHSPSDLAAENANLLFGDPYAGATQLDQTLVYRPGTGGHRTSLPGLWHIGASTHPGPGLGAGSGWIVARSLTKRQRIKRRFRS